MPKPAIPKISPEEILEKMSYVPGRGLIWNIDLGLARAGDLVGGRTEGAKVRLNGVRVQLNHVVWFIHKGYWPSERREWIRYKDGNRINNTIENLHAEQMGL